MFPQGELHSIYDDNIKFEIGAQRIIDRSDDFLQVVLVANFIDYFSDSKPNLFMNIKTFEAKDLRWNLLEKEYKHFYASSLNEQKSNVL